MRTSDSGDISEVLWSSLVLVMIWSSTFSTSPFCAFLSRRVVISFEVSFRSEITSVDVDLRSVLQNTKKLNSK